LALTCAGTARTYIHEIPLEMPLEIIEILQSNRDKYQSLKIIDIRALWSQVKESIRKKFLCNGNPKRKKFRDTKIRTRDEFLKIFQNDRNDTEID